MLERGMRVKIAGLVKGAQYNGLEATVQELLCSTDKRADGRVRVVLEGLDGKEMSIKLENCIVLSCIFCQETSPPSILSGCGCQGTIADVRDGAVVAHVRCRAKHFLEVTPQVAGTKASRSDMTAIAVIQNMWSKCPKCNQPLTGEMRIGLAEAWWSQVCDQEEKDPVGYMGAVVNLTVTLAMLKEDPERREQYQLFLSKAHACLKKYGKPDRPRDSAQALNIQEEPEMCRAFFTILAWHRHGDHTSFGIMMQDLGKDLRGDPRLDKLGLQLLLRSWLGVAFSRRIETARWK
jgi:hypothetical protein